MKRVSLGLALLLCSAVPAFADGADEPVDAAGDSGLYAALRGGAVFFGEDDAPGVEYNTGFGILASGGYAFDWGLAVEGEFAFRRVPVEGALIDADLDQWTFMANALYEFPAGPVRPYVGGGIGLGVAHMEGQSFIGPVDQTDEAFAYQAIGGMAIPVSDCLDLVVDYRFSGMNLEEFEETHSVTGGARFRF